jgi:hypothetical protein
MENEKEPVTQTDDKTEETVTTTVEKTEQEPKTFTQEEVNAMLNKEKKKMPSKEDLKAFREWQEAQKTDAEKQKELTQKMTDTESENTSLKQEIQVLKSGVNVDDVDYILFKVSKMEGEFEDNLRDFLKNNPKYLQTKKDTEETTTTNGTSVKKLNEEANSGVNAILKQKHPDLFN